MATSKNVALNQPLAINPKATYNPSANSAQGNSTSWGIVQTMVQAGQNTRAQLQAGLSSQVNHAPFVGYCIRRGWLIPVGKAVK